MVSTEGMKEKVVSRMYATPLTCYLNRRVQHGKLHGSKTHHFPRASRRPQSQSQPNPEGDKITATRNSGGAECTHSRKTDREIKLRCIQGKEGRKCKQVPLAGIESSAAAAASTQPTLLFPRKSLRGEGSPNFCPAVYLDCPFGR